MTHVNVSLYGSNPTARDVRFPASNTFPRRIKVSKFSTNSLNFKAKLFQIFTHIHHILNFRYHRQEVRSLGRGPRNLEIATSKLVGLDPFDSIEMFAFIHSRWSTLVESGRDAYRVSGSRLTRVRRWYQFSFNRPKFAHFLPKKSDFPEISR